MLAQIVSHNTPLGITLTCYQYAQKNKENVNRDYHVREVYDI